jgi:hypothetical protein
MHDPKVLWLMSCTGGGCMHSGCNGLTWMDLDKLRSADLFFQCILVEVVKVQVNMEWIHCFSPSQPERLPVLEDIPHFLKFIDAILLQTGAKSTSEIIQEQYEISQNYNDRSTFGRFLFYLGAQLEQWLARRVYTLRKPPPVLKSGDIFKEMIERLATFINSEDGLGSFMCTKAPFQCQHILMNLDKLVDEFPTGFPKFPVVAIGGSFGAQLLRKETFLASDNAMVETVMSGLLKKYNEGTIPELTILGLKETGTLARDVQAREGNPLEEPYQKVVIAINGRPLTTCDPKHGCCMCYFYYERKYGCTKGAAKNPKLQFSHCHPIPRAISPQEEASDALFTFVERVESKQWNLRHSDSATMALPISSVTSHSPGKPPYDEHPPKRMRRNRWALPFASKLTQKRKRLLEDDDSDTKRGQSRDSL